MKNEPMTTTMKTLTIEDIEWTVTPLAEDQSPEDCFAFDDEEQTTAICDAIREEAKWNEWAWCCVEVKGQWNGLEAVAYLGACNYQSRADFESESGYLPQLMKEVLEQIQLKAERIAQALNS